MADNDGGSNTMLALLVGGLLLFVAMVFAFGWYPGSTRTAEVNIKVPEIQAPKVPSPSK
jgi:hypothetical protein